MTTDQASTTTLRVGSLLFDCQHTDRTARVIERDQAILLQPGETLCEFPFTGYRFIARATGRTRRFWGMDCPTFERYEIETFADGLGAIWGRSKCRIPSTWASRPENINTTA